MASPRSRKSAPVDPVTVAATVAPVVPLLTLALVIEATKAGEFVFTPVAFHQPLIISGDVEINPDITDEHGSIATRATPKHLESNPEMKNSEVETAAVAAAATAAAVTAKPAKPKFEVEANVPIPERTRNATGLRAGRTPVYPFDDLEIGQSFFVPNASADKPAAKAMASTVAGANARYTELIEGQTRVNRKGVTVPATKQLRKFKIFDTEKVDAATGEVVKGARVFRVELGE